MSTFSSINAGSSRPNCSFLLFGYHHTVVPGSSFFARCRYAILAVRPDRKNVLIRTAVHGFVVGRSDFDLFGGRNMRRDFGWMINSPRRHTPSIMQDTISELPCPTPQTTSHKGKLCTRLAAEIGVSAAAVSTIPLKTSTFTVPLHRTGMRVAVGNTTLACCPVHKKSPTLLRV